MLKPQNQLYNGSNDQNIWFHSRAARRFVLGAASHEANELNSLQQVHYEDPDDFFVVSGTFAIFKHFVEG